MTSRIRLPGKPSASVTLRSASGFFTFERHGGRFHERRCPRRLTFILVGQCLKLRSKFRVSRAYRQSLEEKRPLVQLLASRLLDQFAFGLAHPRTPRRLM